MDRVQRWCAFAGMLTSLAACAAEIGDAQAVTLEHEPSAAREAPEPAPAAVLPILSALRGATPDVIDVRRSLAVTDQVILARFPLQRVLTQLARGARVRADALGMFTQWWDTQNPGRDGDPRPHCDDEVDAKGKPLLNGYPYDCRGGAMEGIQAGCRSLSDPACAYTPIGLFNRFDLAPEDGAHCGEHRILYAKTSGASNRVDRNLVIFEAVMPNPQPWLGLAGCRPLIEAWAELTFIDDVERRAERLERMYFRGVGFFPPVISFAHYGNNARNFGQVRTNQFIFPAPVPLAEQIWTLREFKLYRECGGRRCDALFVPMPAQNNPLGMLFGDPGADPRARAFQDYLLRENVKRLTATLGPDIAMFTPDAFNSGQSHSSGSTEMNYAMPLASQPNGVRQRIWRALGTLGSDITPEQLVERARTQTCAGCHQLSNSADLGGGLIWPPSLRFVHVTEVDPEQGPDGLRFRISPLLTSSFLPARARIMFDYLQKRPTRRRGFGWSLGGRVVH